jgi:hypothetical protein
MSITRELYETISTIVDDKIKDIKVRREDFDALHDGLRGVSHTVDDIAKTQHEVEARVGRLETVMIELAEAQKQTTANITELTESQKRTDVSIQQNSLQIAELTEAQKQTDTSVAELREAQAQTQRSLTELAESQKRTEAAIQQNSLQIAELTEAQKQTDTSVAELREAQAQTQRSLTELAESQKQLFVAIERTDVQVGRLSDTIGFGLEDIAIVMIPGYLQRHFNIEVEFEKKLLRLPNGQEIEVDLYGEGKKEGEPIIVIGETKSRVKKGDVVKFDKKTQPLVQYFKAQDREVLKTMLGYWIHPDAQAEAQARKMIVIASYQR